MSNTHYTSIPIALTKEEVGDLIELDSKHTNTLSWKPLQTLTDLNTQIINQLAEFCAQHHTSEHLPLCITVIPMQPLVPGIVINRPETDSPTPKHGGLS